MFFAKKNKQNDPKAFVTVLGTSPLALFLTYVLQQKKVAKKQFWNMKFWKQKLNTL